jgi:GT2 family glycosyltransferase
LLLGAAAFSGLAVAASGTTSRASALAAIAFLFLLLLVISGRLGEIHRQLSKLARSQDKLAKSKGTDSGFALSMRRGDQREIDRSGAADERLLRARNTILAVRGNLALASSDTERAPLVHSGEQDSDPGDGPAITVVVSCGNGSRFLASTLESVLRQSYGNWECIIVDDASTDTSVAEAQRFIGTDERFRLIRHKTSGGSSATRNTGLRLAQGTLVTFIGSGDLLMADSLLDRIEALVDAERAIAGSYCGVRNIPESAHVGSMPSHEVWPDSRYLDFVSAKAEPPFLIQAPLMRTEILRSMGGFDESTYPDTHEWALWLRLMRNGYGFVPSRWRTVVHRQESADVSQQRLGAMQDLIARSYREDLSVLQPDAPDPLPLPLPVYEQQLVRARTALQHAAAVMAAGDRTAALSIIADEALTIEPWMDRHIRFDDTVDLAFSQAFGLDADELKDLEDELAPLRREMREQTLSKHRSATPVPTQTNPHRFDALFVPENAAQATAMIEVAGTLPKSSQIAFLNVERVSGSSGVAGVLSTSPYQSFSLNEWVLARAEHRNLVVSFPRGAATEAFVGITNLGGGRAAEIAMDGDTIMRVADTPDYGHRLERLKTADAPGWLVKHNGQGPYVAAAGSTGAWTPWHGSSDLDADVAFTIEEYPATLFDGIEIERFRGIHSGERCVLIGNGPSLNELDLRKLRDEYTIGVNGIFYAAERMGWDPTYYVVEDTAVMRDNTEAIKSYPAGHKFFPSIYRSQVGEAPNVSFFMMNRGYYEPRSPSYCVPRFSTDAAQRLYSGQSVTIINLQLAYYMGFTEIVLIGMDFSYSIPDDAKIEGTNITSMSDDPNHFHPDYFGKGKVWKDPQLDRVLANYQLAKLMFEADGRRIVNATAGGKLELFDRVPYDELFG